MPETVPYPTIAIFCEKVLEEKDNVLSAIRIIDRLTLEHDLPLTPETPAFVVQLIILLRFATLGMGGEHKVRLSLTSPSGKQAELGVVTLMLSPESGGVNFTAPLSVGIKESGNYWMDVYFDDRLLTRTQLDVVIRQKSTSASETN